MSKSLGNFLTIDGLLKEVPGDVIRYQLLMVHYRQPLDWTSGDDRPGKAGSYKVFESSAKRACQCAWASMPASIPRSWKRLRTISIRRKPSPRCMRWRRKSGQRRRGS